MFTSTGANVGCILSKGTWSQQTCATFRPTTGSVAGVIKFTSSKGLCAVDATNGTLSCASDITVASDFMNVGCFCNLLGLIGVLMISFLPRCPRVPRPGEVCCYSIAVRRFPLMYYPLGACSHPFSSGVTTHKGSRWCILGPDVYTGAINNGFAKSCLQCEDLTAPKGIKWATLEHSNRARYENTQTICKDTRRSLRHQSGTSSQTRYTLPVRTQKVKASKS